MNTHDIMGCLHLQTMCRQCLRRWIVTLTDTPAAYHGRMLANVRR